MAANAVNASAAGVAKIIEGGSGVKRGSVSKRQHQVKSACR
jgi:hypothetical protein